MSTENAYAIIESGGKQHRVKVGQRVRFEKIESELGETVTFDKVLLVSNGSDVTVGAPYVSGANVTADVLSHGRAKKIMIIKLRRRKNSRRRQGHRQYFTEFKITGIH